MQEFEQDFGFINLKRLLIAVLRKLWIPILTALLCAGLTLGATHFLITPLYQASAMFYVNNGSASLGGADVHISSADINASKSLVETYIVILNTRETLADVIEQTGLNIGSSTLRDMIVAEPVNDTEIFRVVVTSDDPAEAELIANTIAKVLPERIANIVEGSLAKVVDTASYPAKPSSPNHVNNLILGFLFGAVLGVFIVVLQEFLSISIREEEDITQICQQPILAEVPDMSQADKVAGYGYSAEKRKPREGAHSVVLDINSSFAVAEAYNLLRTNLQYSFADEEACRVIGISSAISGEGKSVSAINLACSMSQLNKRVLLIDCDMRKPTVAEKLRLKKKPGLSGLLTGQCTITEAVQTYQDERARCSFYAISAGQNPPNPIELLSSHRMSVVLQAIRKSFDYVILDLPPVCEVSDALAVKQSVDGILLVVRQNRCNRIVLKETLRKFEYVGAKIVGIVFNSVSVDTGKYGYGRRFYKKNKQ